MKKKILTSLALVAVITLSVSAFTQDDAIIYRGAGSWYCDYSVLGGFGADGNVDTSLAGFGLTGALPFAKDVTGDGIADMVVVQDNGGGGFQWVAAHSVNDGTGKGLMSKATTSIMNPFGTISGSCGNLMGDVDGDGIQDCLTINANFNWYCQLSSSAGIGGGAFQGPAQFGLTTVDSPILGDFDGDGYDDIGIYRTNASGSIYWESSAGGVIGAGAVGPVGQIGGGATPYTDSLIICDLNGDAYADAVMVRQDGAGLIEWYGLINTTNSSGAWGYLNYSNPGTSLSSFGLDGTDTPMIGDVNGDGLDDIIVFRDSSATWYASLTTTGGDIGDGTINSQVLFGLSGDVPLLGQMKLVPEPATFGLLAILGLAFLRRK